jgi:hypothetical protein
MRERKLIIGTPHRVEVVTASMDTRAFARGNIGRLPTGRRVPVWMSRYNARRYSRTRVWMARS